MKKSLIIAFCLLCAFPLLGQQSRGPQVPVAIADSFRTQYPDGKLMRWNMTKDKAFVAYFYQDDMKSMAYYAPNGRWVKTKSYPINLPPTITRMLSQLYDDPVIGKIQKTEYYNRPTSYVVLLDTGPEIHKLLFAESGEVKGKKVKAKNRTASTQTNR